jgi:4-hydroxybenzoate polyprenyltransferase
MSAPATTTVAPTVTGPRGVRAILADIRFEQTLFSLPFLLLAALAAEGGWPAPRTLVLILVALVGARSSAMAFNRFADADFDGRNPRTAGRAVPSGRVSRRSMGAFAVLAAGVFLAAAAALNTLCLVLAPVALLFLVGYSWTKRLTPACHLVLGTTLGIAPLGAWAAVRGTFLDADGAFDPGVWLLALGVGLWVAGFDVIYACPDAGKDDDEGLHSIPRWIGVERAFGVSAAMHVGALLAFAAAGHSLALGPIFFVGLAVGALILGAEHVLVRPGRYTRMATAFFRMNAVFSTLLLVTGALDILRG